LVVVELLFKQGGERRMCHSSKWEYWDFLRERERREDEARRSVEVFDERDVPEPKIEADPEPEPERELVSV
jgi:hypothetical protein